MPQIKHSFVWYQGLSLVAVQSCVCLLPQDAVQNSQNNQTELNIRVYSDNCPDTEVEQAPGNGADHFLIEMSFNAVAMSSLSRLACFHSSRSRFMLLPRQKKLPRLHGA